MKTIPLRLLVAGEINLNFPWFILLFSFVLFCCFFHSLSFRFSFHFFLSFSFQYCIHICMFWYYFWDWIISGTWKIESGTLIVKWANYLLLNYHLENDKAWKWLIEKIATCDSRNDFKCIKLSNDNQREVGCVGVAHLLLFLGSGKRFVWKAR